MTSIEMIDFIDDFLRKQEDVLHGIEGRDCTISRKYLDDIKKQLRLNDVVKSLPIKKYEINFGGNVLAGLEITNNEPTIISAMNGWGNGISKDDITITEK